MKKILLPLLLILFLFPIQTNALTLSAGKSEPADDCVFVVVNGDFVRTGIAKACFDMNLLRKEACEEGVINPNTGMPLKKGTLLLFIILPYWINGRRDEQRNAQFSYGIFVPVVIQISPT